MQPSRSPEEAGAEARKAGGGGASGVPARLPLATGRGRAGAQEEDSRGAWKAARFIVRERKQMYSAVLSSDQFFFFYYIHLLIMLYYHLS